MNNSSTSLTVNRKKEHIYGNLEVFIPKINSNHNIICIEKNFYCISKIYLYYFPWEPLNVSNYQKANLSEKSFFKLCQDFLIIPIKISNSKLNEIFQSILTNTQNIFKIFQLITSTIKDFENLNTNIEFTIRDFSNKGTYFTLYHLITAFYLIGVELIISKIWVEQMISNSDLVNEEFKKRTDSSK